MKYIFTLFVLIFSLSNAQYKELILQPGEKDGTDAWVWSFDPAREVNLGEKNESNGGLNNVLRAEVWKWGGKSESDTIRGLIKFDLSEIPKKSSVIEAKLSLYYFANEGFTPQLGNNEVLIRRVSEAWDESKVNWVNQPAATEHNQILVPATTSQNQDYIDIDVRNLVQEMVYFPENNFGFLLKLKSEVEFNGVSFASSENEDKTKHPKLVIKYIPFE